MFIPPVNGIEKRSKTGILARGLALIGGAVLASVIVLAAPAAARPSERSVGSHISTLSALPRDVRPEAAVAAVAPTISPAAFRVRHSPSKTVPCPSGNLCASVWDPTRSDWKIFDLYYCKRYYLSYWQGAGQYDNAQTGGVRVYFYGQAGNVLKSFTAGGVGQQNWDPVWSIRNC